MVGKIEIKRWFLLMLTWFLENEIRLGEVMMSNHNKKLALIDIFWLKSDEISFISLFFLIVS